ncbi:MAG: hypothetical protein IH845_01255 [Nanoarchaeota archaeon]|nr:hypothetical protein [Nanoarchaeota archaeon]
MWDINKVKREKNAFISSIDETLFASGAIVVSADKSLKVLGKRASKNIRDLKLLL